MNTSLPYEAAGRSRDLWVSLEEIAEYLQVSTDTIHRWIRAKKIPAHRMGRMWRFKVSQVDSWVEEGRVAGKREADRL
jgi:excisionase family DNA binding protein